MKLKLTYIPEEREEAAAVVAATLRLFPGAKVRKDKSKGLKLCIYVTVKTPAALEKAIDKTAPTGV